MSLGSRVAFGLQVPELSRIWVPEGIATAHLTRMGKVYLQRVPIAFCVLSTEAVCRYPEELVRSLDELEAQQDTDFGRYETLLGSLPTLCGSLGEQPCNPQNTTIY